MTDGLARDRDHLPFNRTNGVALGKLIAALRAGNMEVRRYEKAFLHAKAYIFNSQDNTLKKPEGIIAGSSNLTGAGLTRNLELNLGRYDGPVVQEARNWFNDLWEEAEPYDLAGLFEVVFEPRTPWEIFIRVLWQLYGDEVEGDAKADENLPLTSFQKHGVARALRLIRDTGGVIVADEVGLGKTFIAGEILQLYRERRQRALLVCPAALRDGCGGGSCTSSNFLSNACLSSNWRTTKNFATVSAPMPIRSIFNVLLMNINSSSSTRRTITATPTRPRVPLRCAGFFSDEDATSFC